MTYFHQCPWRVLTKIGNGKPRNKILIINSQKVALEYRIHLLFYEKKIFAILFIDTYYFIKFKMPSY